MGQALVALARPDCCASMWKYCANSAECHSSCSDCCEIEAHTDKVELSRESEMEIEVEGCCMAKKG